MNETTRIPKSDCAFVRFRFGGRLIAGLALAGGLFAGAADAQVEVYALRVGDGTAVDAAYKPFSIMQFSGGSDSLSFSNSWDAPSTDAADRITIGGSFTTYAYLNRSLDGNLLTFAGRDVAVDGSTSDAESIVIGSFSLQNRTFDTSTRIPSDGSGYRAAVTTDGSEFWYSGQGGGVHYATHGQTTPTTSILTTGAGNPSNIETAGVQIINNTIMFGRRAGSDRGIQVMPEGLHRTHGEDRAVIPGSGWKRTAADTPSSYNDFKFLDENTLFVANSNNIQVYHRGDPSGEDFDLLTGANQGLSSLTGETHLSLFEQDGEIYLFYTSGTGTNDNGLYSVLWDESEQTFGTPQLLATAGDGYTFGGLVVIPEPSTYALLFGAIGLGTAILIRRRRS